jgi:hypothetical protein
MSETLVIAALADFTLFDLREWFAGAAAKVA